MMIIAIQLLTVALSGQNVSQHVAHPHIACWNGERIWTPLGQALSTMISFDTQEETGPYLITHNRDQIRTGDELTQDYNFLDYWFGEPAFPIRVRYYFRNDEGVQIILPGSIQTPLSLAEARERMPSDVMCYLQRRFDRIEVLVAEGYELLWIYPR